MVEFIAHRINTKAELAVLDKRFGVELDIRDYGDTLHMEHDPFCIGESFEKYCHQYKYGTMILNIKSERIEQKVLKTIKDAGVEKYFFLDSSFPMLKALSDSGETNIAIRFSEFEGLDTIRAMQGRAKWVWVDCFSKMPLTLSTYNEIKQLGYKICIVSPELQGQDEKLELYGEYLKFEGLTPDAICSKVYNFERWQHFFKFS